MTTYENKGGIITSLIIILMFVLGFYINRKIYFNIEFKQPIFTRIMFI